MSLQKSLDQLHRNLSRLWSDITKRPGGLTYSEYEYLRGIERLDGDMLARDDLGPEEDHGHHLQDIVAVLGVNKASASIAIGKLEKKGLVERFPCQYDARAQHILLTQQGRDSLRQEEVVYRDLIHRIETRLTDDERAVFEAALKKITND